MTPPRLATRLLAASIADVDWRDTVLGDLHEEFTARAASRRRGARLSADVWYWSQAIRLGMRLARPSVRAYIPGSLPTGDPLVRTLSLETRFAVRALLKRPALTALVVATLGLSLGANAAIFEMIDALVLRPFTMPDLDRLVLASETGSDIGFQFKETVSPANFLDWKRQTTTLERLAALDWWPVNLAGTIEPERVEGFRVTEDFFPALGVQALLGRTLAPDEFEPGRDRRIVISHSLWQRRFGGDPAVVGRRVLVDAEPYDVVGVMPKAFQFPRGTEVWGPLEFDRGAAARAARYLTVIGKLAPGRTLHETNAELGVIAGRLAAQYPEVNKDHGALVQTLVAGMRDQGLGPMLSLWQASALFVLLIACANIASLLLTRGAERQRELAVRLAIGASRARLVREQLIESVVLAVAAIPAAIAVAWFAVRLIRINLPPRIVRWVDGWQTMDVDGRMIAFTGILAVVTVALFGVLPALHASRSHVTAALKDGGRGATSGRSRQRLRRTLVVAEIALALPLLVASALGTIGARRFVTGPQGYNPDHVLTMRVGLPDAKYGEPAARRRFVDDTIDQLRRLPGVEAVAAMNILPSGSSNSGRIIEVEGRPNPDPANPPAVDFRAVTPDYFSALQMPIRRGRAFTSADTADSLPVAIVSESLAAKYFPDEDPLNRRIKLGSSGTFATIVGISADHIHDWFDRRNYPTAFRPYAQTPTAGVAYVVRAAEPALGLAAAAAVHAVDPMQPVSDVLPWRDLIDEKTIGLRYVAAIMAVFGGLALLLAVVGVYSLMAYVVTQRTHEIGLRMALGATRRDVLGLALGQTALLAAGGAVLGLALAAGFGRLMEAGLLGIVASDARVSVGLASVLVAAALAAGYLPARRAARIDPMVALRAD